MIARKFNYWNIPSFSKAIGSFLLEVVETSSTLKSLSNFVSRALRIAETTVYFSSYFPI